MTAFNHFNTGDDVIVRGTGSGAVFGKFLRAEQGAVLIANGVQLWSWTAKKGISLIDVGRFGLSDGELSHPGGDVLILDAVAVISVTPEAAATIRAIKPSNSGK